MTVLHQDRSEPRVGNGTVIHRGHSYTIFEKVSRNRRKKCVDNKKCSEIGEKVSRNRRNMSKNGRQQKVSRNKRKRKKIALVLVKLVNKVN